jgi:hypothetical protein
MPRPRKTSRGPQAIASASPFTPETMHALLRGEVIKNKRTLDDPAMAPAIAHLTHVANILQAWVRDAAWEEQCKDLRTARLQAWPTWVVTGLPPSRLHTGGIMGQPRHGCIEPAGLGRWGMLYAAEGNHAAALAAREHVFALVRGIELVRGLPAMKKTAMPYYSWLVATERAPLITRSIKQCKDYAPDLWKIFRSELRPESGDEAAFRFIASTARTITGEKLSANAVKKELRRWQRQQRLPRA